MVTYLNNLRVMGLKGLDEGIQIVSQITIIPHIDFLTHTEQHRVTVLIIIKISNCKCNVTVNVQHFPATM